MAIHLKIDKCTGCGACVNICPGDLWRLDKKSHKAYLLSQEDCWNCFSCAKVCEPEAIEVRLPYSIAGYGASLIPKIKPKSIIWKLKTKDGNEEVFEIETLK